MFPYTSRHGLLAAALAKLAVETTGEATGEETRQKLEPEPKLLGNRAARRAMRGGKPKGTDPRTWRRRLR